jgi:hypothetical protein
MRTLVLSLFAYALASCAHPALVVVDEATAARTPDGHVQVDVLVTGAEQAGGTIGYYCVSAHWFGPVDPGVTDPAPSYYGELEALTQCFSGLGDGDRRAVRFVSTKTTELTPGTPIRCQARVASGYSKMEIDNP